MLENVGEGRSKKGAFGEQFGDQIFRLLWHVFRVLWLLFQDTRFGRILVVLIKGQFSTKERVQNDSETPDINLFTSIFFALEHLGCAVT